MLNARIIRAPHPDVIAMLKRRLTPDCRAQLTDLSFSAVGLVQTSIPNLYFFADVAQKASGVYTAELLGSCPQHITTLAFFGETSAVETAMQAIRTAESSEV